MFPFNDLHKELDKEMEKFVAGFIEPGASERNNKGVYPKEAMKLLSEVNIDSLIFNDKDGQMALDLISACIVVSNLAYADASIAHLVETINFGVILPVISYGTDKQKNRVLKDIKEKSEFATIAFTEPEKILNTNVLETADGYILNGIKTMITCAGRAKYALVHAKYLDSTAIFIVDLKCSSGVVINNKDGTMGLNSLEVSDIYFHDVKLPADALLGYGMDIVASSMEAMRISNAALALGLCKRALNEAVIYCKTRNMNNGKMMDMQIVNYGLAELRAEIECMEAVVFSAAAMYGERDVQQMLYSSSCKLIVTEKAKRICDRALQFFGGYGYMKEMVVERIYRDVRVLTIIGGISDMLKWSVGRYF